MLKHTPPPTPVRAAFVSVTIVIRFISEFYWEMYKVEQGEKVLLKVMWQLIRKAVGSIIVLCVFQIQHTLCWILLDNTF